MKIALLLLALLVAPAFAQHQHHHSEEAATDTGKLGTVHFPISCSPAAQARFERGVAYLHSFWYENAQKQFRELAAAEPNCSMAHWGAAMSLWHQLWDRPDHDTVAKGAAELARAAPAASDRERRYLDATSTFFNPDPKQEHLARAQAYAAKMHALYEAYPDDIEAGAFYALSLLTSEAPSDDSLTNERAALAVLQPLFAKYPDHPGLAHYIIHTCDTPALAQQGLAAAREYARIAPASPHAVHMPGHIFARLGLWQEDIASNRASIDATHYAMAHHQGGAGHQLHAMDFLVYAYLQTGQDNEAKKIVDSAPAVLKEIAASDVADPMMSHMDFYTTEFTAIYALERRDWQSAAALPFDPTGHGKLIGYWARTIGAAHLMKPEAAQSNFDSYKKGVAADKAAGMDYGDSEVPEKELAAWVAYSRHDIAAAQKLMSEAADLQDKKGQSEVDIPAREMLADILLEQGKPGEALAQYKTALQLSPNRFNGLYNAGRAAEQSGDKTLATEFYSSLLKQTAAAPPSRPELAHAKQFLAEATTTATRGH